MIDNKLKEISLHSEVELAVYYMRKGVEEIKKISMSNDFYHLPILCLSTGFERLMKCILITDSYIFQNKFLSAKLKYLKGNLGHNLSKLLDEMIKIGRKSKSLASREATRKDLDFMESNKEFRRFITILTEFATFGRYYNLDSLFDSVNDPIDAFMKFEYEIAKDKNIEIDIKKDPYPKINKEIIKLIETFARALCRFLTLGEFGKVGNSLSVNTHDFLFLRDDQLGEGIYLDKD